MKKQIRITPAANTPDRKSRGRMREDASFPVVPSRVGLPVSYASVLGEIKQRIQAERLRVVMAANSAMIILYWDIGRLILERQEREGWGAKVIDRLSADLREAYPDMSGLSSRNLKYMRAFAAAWPGREIMQQLAAQIPWFHTCTLLDKIGDPQIRFWYARRALEEGWSRNILVLQIESQLHERQGKTITNFPATLPPADSDMASQVFMDPYLFDFLGTADPRRERAVEQALIDNIQHFLLELGSGFAFVGRQVHLEFSSNDYFLDLLFYHLNLRCYVVVVEKRLLQMMAHNPHRMDYYKKYQEIVADYNREKDRVTVEETFAKLAELANSLDAEQKRAVQEGLSEEELALFDLLFRENVSKTDREKLKQASRTLLALLQELIKPMPTWTQNTQTQAEVKVLVLDTLWEKLPRPPFSEEETEALAERVYDFVWQQSAGGRFMENMRAV